MKVWLDDQYEERKSWFDADWVHCRWPSEVIDFLKTGTVTDLSLDHDLGQESGYTTPITGLDVVKWLEIEVATKAWTGPLPRIRVHSHNPVGRANISACLRSIYALYERHYQQG